MTTIEQWYGWPEKVSVNCPKCGSKVDVKDHKQIIKRVGPTTRPKEKHNNPDEINQIFKTVISKTELGKVLSEAISYLTNNKNEKV